MTANPPAAWYPDPSGVGEHRYWDGSAWTPGVAIGGQVMERPMPWPPLPTAPDGAAAGPAHDPDDHRIDLPPRAALYALVGFVAGVAAGIALAIAGALLDLPGIVVLVLNMVGLWSGLLGACVLASRRWGTGRITADFGLRICGADVGWGVLVGLGARFAGGIVLIPFLELFDRLESGNEGVFDEVGPNVAAFLVLAVVIVVGAPLVEELFFRGLLLRALEGGMALSLAIALQAVLFGLAHYNPVLGLANVGLVAVIITGGVIFGHTAHRHGVGRSAVAHATFNVVTVIAASFLIF